MNPSVVAKSLVEATNFRSFLDGSYRSSAKLQSAFIGHGIYKPGWKWSLHAGKQTGKPSENHIGYIISGKMTICDANENKLIVGSGDAFEVGPGHDAWVEGNEPCIAIDFFHCS